MIGKIVFPGEYVAFELVEECFKTAKGFNYFICRSKEDDVESRGGHISNLSVPIQEMMQHRNELCRELFNVNTPRTLSMDQRVRLARALKAKYRCSAKQIARLSGLIYDEVKDLLT